jgi:DNA-binding CsgD family transcriptional regulator
MWPACLTYLAETCITLGDDAAAEMLAAELQPFSGTNLTVAFTISFGPADRLIGDLLDISGRHDEADGAFADALDLAERSASPLWKAEVLFDQAAALAGRGQRAAAAVLQTEAETLAAGIGMAWRRVRRDLASTEPDQLSPLPGGLSEREADVLRLVAAGLSNRQIGERLFISQNTAANHVRAILRKTSCANRTEATSYAHHNGIVETGSRSLGGVTP